MIFCNLAELMANRGVNISTVSKLTGISRTTLTALRYNTFKGIQLETLDELCRFFNVKPDKILLFSKYDLNTEVSINNFDIDSEPKAADGEVRFTVGMAGGAEISFYVHFDLFFCWNGADVSINIEMDYYDPNENPYEPDLEKSNSTLKKIFNSFESGIVAFYDEKLKDEIIKGLGLSNWCGEIEITGGLISNLM